VAAGAATGGAAAGAGAAAAGAGATGAGASPKVTGAALLKFIDEATFTGGAGDQVGSSGDSSVRAGAGAGAGAGAEPK
jgi:hypothetical protein